MELHYLLESIENLEERILCEGKTGEMMKKSMTGVQSFSQFSDDDWIKLGDILKNMGATRSVFSKAMSSFFRLLRHGIVFPISTKDAQAFMDEKNIKGSGWADKGAGAILGALAADKLLDKEVKEDGNAVFSLKPKMMNLLNFLKSKNIAVAQKNWSA